MTQFQVIGGAPCKALLLLVSAKSADSMESRVLVLLVLEEEEEEASELLLELIRAEVKLEE